MKGLQLPPRYGGPIEVIGQGGFGLVLRAQDLVLGVPVAVKVPFRAADRDLAHEVATELSAAARLRHPGIVQVLDSGTDSDGNPYLSMEYADAGSMQQWVDPGPPPWGEFLPILDAVLEAVGFAHAGGLVHRDIKPQNVLLSRRADGSLRPKLGDFGLAKVAARRGDFDSTRLGAGTLLYMAPEIFEGELAAVHPAADLYACGVLLYALLAGRPPWDAADYALITEKLQRAHRPFVPRPGYDAPDGLAPLLDRLLDRRPAWRFDLAADVRAALRDLSRPAGALARGQASRSGAGGGGGSVSVSSGSSGSASLAGRTRRASELPAEPPEPAELSPVPVGPAVALVRMPLLVGRWAERERLWAAARRASKGTAPGLALLGPAGSGRSRLAAWLASALEESGSGRCLHVRVERGSSPFEALARGLARLLGVARMGGSRLRDRVADWMAARGAADPSDVDALQRWLEGGPGGSAPSLDAREEAARRVALGTRVLALEARRGLACAWIEEGDEPGAARELAERLLADAQASRVPLLLLYEPPGAATDPGGVQPGLPRGFEPLVLASMPEPEIRDLLRDLVPLGAGTRELAERARGNPQRAVEGARLLAEQQRGRGAILAQTQEISFVGRPAAAEVGGAASPPASPAPGGATASDAAVLRFSQTMTVPRIAEARIEAFLAGDERAAREQLFALLALLPRPCAGDLLDAAWARGSPAARLAPLREAARLAGILQLGDDGALDFVGDAVAQAAEARLPGLAAEEAALLRAAAADAVLSRGSAAAAGERMVAARLLMQAGQAGRALELLLALGTELLPSDADAARAAWTLAAEASDALALAPNDERRVAAALGACRASRSAGDMEAAASALAGLEPESVAASQRGLLLELRASLAVVGGDPAGGGALAARACADFDALGDASGVARATLVLADSELAAGRRDAALAACERALEAARQAGAPREELAALTRLGRTRRISGDLLGARGSLEAALPLAQRAGSQAMEGVVLRELGNVALLSGRTADAEDLLRSAIARFEGGGYRAETATTRISLGELARSRGDGAAARKEYSAALSRSQVLGNRFNSVVALLNLGIVELAMDRLDSAERRLAGADELLPPGTPHRLRAHLEALRLALRAARGDWAGAEEALERVARSPGGLGADGDILALVERAADAAARAGETTLAVDGLSLARGVAETGRDAVSLARIRKKLDSVD